MTTSVRIRFDSNFVTSITMQGYVHNVDTTLNNQVGNWNSKMLEVDDRFNQIMVSYVDINVYERVRTCTVQSSKTSLLTGENQTEKKNTSYSTTISLF